MKILHVIDSMNLYQGGPSVSVPALAEAQAKLGHRVTIVCRDYGYLGPMAKAEGVEVRSVPSSRWTKGQGPGLASADAGRRSGGDDCEDR